jgi:hypothetical protein
MNSCNINGLPVFRARYAAMTHPDA